MEPSRGSAPIIRRAKSKRHPLRVEPGRGRPKVLLRNLHSPKIGRRRSYAWEWCLPLRSGEDAHLYSRWASIPTAHMRGPSPGATQEDDAMDATKIQDYARQLLAAHGARAIAEAAQKAAACEKAGDKEQAQTWRRVEAALLLMHGPRQS